MGQSFRAGSGLTALQIEELVNRLREERGEAAAGSAALGSGGEGYGLDLIWEDE